MSSIFDKTIVNETFNPQVDCLTDTSETDASGHEGLQWQPFPVECLPDTLREYCMAVARSTRTDVGYIGTFILPVVSSSIGSHIVLQATQDWQVPAILWSLLVADSGSGKSPTWKLAVRPLI